MPVRTANAEWKGDLQKGTGHMSFGNGAFDGQYSFSSRFENGTGTNPEELIAAAHAGCFSMALSNGLAKAGHTPTRVQTTASVHLDKQDGGFGITRIDLDCEAEVPGMDDQAFQAQAQDAKAGCPVSKLLKGAEITLNAHLVR
ncbi:MAG TPA: OsmC family protein [Rhodothermales bacterium]|nr:OsmC family protein [Rhodothermales bacterium]